MPSPSNSNVNHSVRLRQGATLPQAGFTLIEVLVVLAILVFVMGLGLFMSMDVWRGTSMRSEREVVVSLLERARSRAMANLYEESHGVCVVGGNYVLFRGSSCDAGDPRSELLPVSESATSTGLETPIIFNQLSGTSSGGRVSVTQDMHTATITVNHEGAIIW